MTYSQHVLTSKCLCLFYIILFFATPTSVIGASNGISFGLGCLYFEDVCNNGEFCFDDNLSGRCLSKTEGENDDVYLVRYPNISGADKSLVEYEIRKLDEIGRSGTDPYSQCILQNIIRSIQLQVEFDVEDCEEFFDEPEEEILESNDINDIVQQLLQERDDESEQDDNPAYELTQDEDGAVTIDARNRASLLPSLEKRSEDISFLPFGGYFDQNEDFDDGEEEQQLDDEAVIDDDNSRNDQFEEDDDTVYWRPENDAFYPLNEEVEEDVEEPDDDIILSSPDDMRDYNVPVDYIISNSDDYDTDYLYPDSDDRETVISPDEALEATTIRNMGLGSSIFNRNERLDVKKPGPFYKNSANNFFLDKLFYTDYEDQARTPSSSNSTTKDMGQLEYEMPLLAPVKDKRELPLTSEHKELSERGNADNDRTDFVHITTKDRFNSWRQGSDLIEYLARTFGIPSDALSDRIIENQHVQFRVRLNPQNVDAGVMAKNLDEDIDLRKRIDNHLGINIDRAANGNKNDVQSVLYPGGSNFPLLLLVVIAASTTAALLVVSIILLLVKRRNKAKNKANVLDQEGGGNNAAQEEYKQLCRDWSRSSKKIEPVLTKTQESKDSTRSSTSSWPDEPNSNNMDISTGHMVLAYMEDHLKNKQRLEQEWVALCGYEAEPSSTTAAFKAENKKKNRYPDKLPYDHNRVILNAMVNGSNSDYINASSVADHDPRNPSYIVTQAPLSSTVADFWQMIWEQGCVVIVMLTRLQDNGHQLCHRYWPEEGSEQYHIFEVHLVSEHIWCDDYLVRSVYLKNTRTGETRTVTQFHFRSWPSHGVPSSTKALLEFRRKVNKSYRGRSCPICVHCSDGVGRSGTYILIDMVLNRMTKGCKEIDIAAALEHIRDQRGGMVQSRQQFEFCLMAVAEEVHAILKALPQ